MDYSWLSRGTSDDGVVVLDASGRVDYANAAAMAMFGYSDGDLVGVMLETLVPEPLAAIHAQLRQACNATAQPSRGRVLEVTGRRRDGGEVALHVTLRHEAPSGRVSIFLQSRSGIAGLPLEFRGGFGLALPDRHALQADLARMEGGDVCVLLLEIDPFDLGRSSLGRGCHDAVLRACAGRLARIETWEVRLYRVGEDAFGFLIALPAGETRPEPQLAAIASALQMPFETEGRSLHLEPSIGYACAPAPTRGGDDLIADAALALAASKAAGNRPVCYDPGLRSRSEHRQQTLAHLRRALARGEFEVHYQPQVDLRRGAVVAVEALLRWRHPERGLLQPRDFIEVLNDSDLSVQVGDWVLRQACMQVAAWNRLRDTPLTVAVNVFPRQFDCAVLPAAILRALAESGLAPGQLEIEITENIVIDPGTQSAEVFQALVATGVLLVLDDFGTGYASLTCLAQHPVSKLKIDKSFIDGLENSIEAGAEPLPGKAQPKALDMGRGYRTILKSVRALAAALGLGTVVEGVETEATATLLREIGFDVGQGFLWGRPLDAAGCAAALGLAE